jgi:transposase
LPHAGGPPRRLDLGDAQVIRQRLVHQPDRTLDERGETIAHQRGKSVSRATRGRAVQRLNLPRKKGSVLSSGVNIRADSGVVEFVLEA